MKLQSKDQRVHTFLSRHLRAPVYRFDQISDPRARRGRRWSLSTLLWTVLSGMLAGCRTLRQVEDLTDERSKQARLVYPGPVQTGRVPDTTLAELIPRLSVDELREQQRWQVKTLWRSKCLAPFGLPCGVISIDGKGMGALDHDADGSAQKGRRSQDGTIYWLGRTLRAVLTSAQAKPALDQMAIPADTNEMGAFPAFFAALLFAYGAGDLFEIVTVDAGMTSKHNADLVAAAHKGYIMALKGTQPELLAEAQRLLLPRLLGDPCAQTPWERAQGRLIRRSLYRTAEIAGYHGWSHLRQVWLVRQESNKDGVVTIEDRYFLTNLTTGRLSPAQCLTVVRGHWGIENDCFWSLDAQFGEDFLPWMSTGRSVEILGLFRLLAYNLLQLGRKRHLRPRSRPGRRPPPPPSWQQMFRWVAQAFRLNDPGSGPVPAD